MICFDGVSFFKTASPLGVPQSNFFSRPQVRQASRKAILFSRSQVRQASRKAILFFKTASPPGVPPDLQSGVKKCPNLFNALRICNPQQRRMLSFCCWGGDCKSPGFNRSNLFLRRISNPPGRLAGLRFWSRLAGLCSCCRLAGLRFCCHLAGVCSCCRLAVLRS